MDIYLYNECFMVSWKLLIDGDRNSSTFLLLLKKSHPDKYCFPQSANLSFTGKILVIQNKLTST